LKNILIAGATGHLGSYLLGELKDYHNTLGLSKSGNTKDGALKIDLTNEYKTKSFAKSCQNFDVLIFLVGLAHSKGEFKQYPFFRKINVTTLKNLLSSLERQKKLPSIIIYTSTISVYGEELGTSHYIEDSKLNPKSPYGKTKSEAERYLLEYYQNSSYILRLAPIYSSKFTLNLKRRSELWNFNYKVGNGNKKLSLCNIKNLKYAIDGIIEGNVPKGIYNLSDEKPYTFNNIIDLRKKKVVIRLPNFFVLFTFFIGKYFKNVFLRENSIKLLSDNIYPSNKIREFLKLPFNITNLS
tara:strand:+ start:296 stop:1186 length:891 start_codon:yes stop_codon:yes gene_type:complete